MTKVTEEMINDMAAAYITANRECISPHGIARRMADAMTAAQVCERCEGTGVMLDEVNREKAPCAWCQPNAVQVDREVLESLIAAHKQSTVDWDAMRAIEAILATEDKG